MCISSNEYSEKNYKINFKNNAIQFENNTVQVIKCPRIIARMKLFGGALTFQFDDTMNFEMPTEEQRENLKRTFGIEVEWVKED